VAADMAGYADETDDVARTDDVADATDALAWLG
jgi:hypothetical protein